MALQSVTVDYRTNGTNHVLTIDCGSSPIDLIVYWRKSSDVIYSEIKTLTGQSGIIKVNADMTSVNDSFAPNFPMVNMDTVKYNTETELLKFDINIFKDIGTPIYYKVIDLTNEVQYENIEASVIAGIKAVAIKVDSNPITQLMLSDSVGTAIDTFEFNIADNGIPKYIHIAAIDNSNNLSETNHTEIDITPPSKDNSFHINEIRLAVTNQILRFTTERLIASISGSSHPRNLTVFRDIKLINYKTQEVLSSSNNLMNVLNYDLEVDPFGNPRILADTVLQLVSKTYNMYGASLGESLSRPFLIDLNSPTVVINYIEDLPLFIEKNNFNSIELKWEATGELSTSIIKYKIQYRNKHNSSLTWNNWVDIGESYTKSFIITNDMLNINGFNIHEFRVMGVTSNGDTVPFNYPNFVADILPIFSNDPTDLIYLIRIPSGIFNLIDERVKLKTTINSITTEHFIDMNYNLITTSAGENDIGFLVQASNMNDIINEDNTINKDLIIDDLKATLMVTDDFTEFTRIPKASYSTSIDPTMTDIYLVGYLYELIENIPSTYNLTFTDEVDNPFVKSTTINIESVFELVNKQDSSIKQSIPINISNYKLSKYGNLHKPTIDYDGIFTNVSTDPEIVEFNEDIKLKTTIATEDSHINSQYIKVVTSFTRNNGTQYQTLENINLSNPLTQPGSYLVTAKTVYDDGRLYMESEEALLSFTIRDSITTYTTPTYIVDNENNVGASDSTVEFYLYTNLLPAEADSEYVYKLKMTNNPTKIKVFGDNEVPKIDSDGNRTYNMVLDRTFLNDGVNDLTLEVIYKERSYTYTEIITMHSLTGDISEDQSIMGYMKTHDSKEFDTSPKYNHAWFDIPYFDYHWAEQPMITTFKPGSRFLFLLPGYTVPIFDPYERIETNQYWTYTSARQKIEEGPYLPGTGIQKRQVNNTALQDDDNPPPIPNIEIIASNPLHPFTPDGSTDCVVLDSIAFNIMNLSTEYTIKYFIDGKPYTLGSLFKRRGKHIFTCIFESTYNYLISHKNINFEIVRNDMFIAPVILYYPEEKWKNTYEIEIDWYMNDIEKNQSDDILKEYKLETASTWTVANNTSVNEASNFKTRFTEDLTGLISDSLVVLARKTYPNGVVAERKVSIPKANAVRDKTIPDIELDYDILASERNTSVYVPSINKHPEWTYDWTINGLPYIEGTPITNYEHNVRNFTLVITAKDRYSTNSKTFTKNFNIDTRPPIKPLLTKGIERTIYKINDFSALTISNKEPDVTYTILLNGE